ncbi:hypothetical protein HUK65_01875 [Rhodobacteraceae bacterium 2376]|uniref:Ceramidase n=1 Tax=Rhabdonatronobacter sediminivivens TaxID=2743469 RepID=A0A7Z0HWP9_9RHOB|nr:ceramidase domain-containing protein [Rhabdonatronobacter sediminivivens]NYS23724.1 hypothetical protein [Rhabdonatronobacter sediminivivens]
MWAEQVIAYCERSDFAFWAEPVNAVTNAAFLIAAAIMWPRARGVPMAQALVGVLAVIGVGSFLWHTHATRWAGLADVLPILVFILIYLFAATRDFLRLGLVGGAGALALFVPYVAAVAWALGLVVPGLGANAVYGAVALLIVIYGLILRGTATGRGLLIGAGVLFVSLGFRMADAAVCDAFPIGTHFMWHILNAVMLAWMIEVYLRYRRGLS